MSFAERNITVAGCTVSFREAGGGDDLLFLHGAGGAESALPFLGRLSANRRVIVPDHPGFGRSDDPPWLGNMDDLVYATLDFIDSLKLERPHILGTSLGGWLALELAIRQPRRFQSLTLIAPAGISPGGIALGDLFSWTAEARVRNTIADPSLAEKIIALPKSAEQLAIAARNFQTTARLARDPFLHNPCLEHWLHRIASPVHLIWGDSDRLLPLSYGQRLRALLPACRFSILQNCGHLPFVEQPDRLLALLQWPSP